MVAAVIPSFCGLQVEATMMGMQIEPAQLFYDFRLDDQVPADHLLRRIDRFLDLDSVRSELRPFYSNIGRPSIDPELIMRMLIVGYCMGIRSERRLCEEVHLNLAYRWFCRLGLDGKVPDHSTFSRNRHGRFRLSDILRHLFKTVVERCLREGLVGGEVFAVDASLIAADARDVARALAETPAYERSRQRRKKVEMLFAHLKRILRLGRLRLRGPCGARDEFLLAATAQNLRKLAWLRAIPLSHRPEGHQAAPPPPPAGSPTTNRIAHETGRSKIAD
jgi:transposase